MDIYSWIVQNKEIIKIFYALVIILICSVITLRSHKIFKLSEYQGIRYLRNAFFFYGIAFFIRYILGSKIFYLSQNNFDLIFVLFEFFFIMGGFFLLYSLLWKKLESVHKPSFSSVFSFRIFMFYLITAIFIVLDYVWQGFYFLFSSQILIFILAFAISFNNYHNRGRNRKFLKFYAFAMLLALTAWIINAVAGILFHWSPIALISIYFLNIIMFLVFLIGVIKTTKLK